MTCTAFAPSLLTNDPNRHYCRLDAGHAGDHLCHCGMSFRSLIQNVNGVNDAVAVALQYGWIDGAHHKQWVIDQMLRHLLGDAYRDNVGPDWDEGIAP